MASVRFWKRPVDQRKGRCPVCGGGCWSPLFGGFWECVRWARHGPDGEGASWLLLSSLSTLVQYTFTQNLLSTQHHSRPFAICS